MAKFNAKRILRPFQVYIENRRKLGVPKYKIAAELGVSKPEIKRIMDGKYPGPKVARKLGIPEVCPYCRHTKPKPKAKTPTPKIGQPGWEAKYFKKINK